MAGTMPILCFLAALPIVFHALSLTGCICVDRNGSISCTTTPYGTSSEAANRTLSLPSSYEPVLKTALELQSKLFSCLDTAAGVFYIISLILFSAKFILRHNETATSLMGNIPKQFLLVSSSVALFASISITQTGNALEFATTQPENSQSMIILAGKPLQIIQWFAFGMSAVFYLVLDFWREPGSGKSFLPFSSKEASTLRPTSSFYSLPLKPGSSHSNMTLKPPQSPYTPSSSKTMPPRPPPPPPLPHQLSGQALQMGGSHYQGKFF
ncbi:hypothetical protein BX600DRAFT_504170 [Xylariales sp. PMI_506]|nr:hypothetical protein BX600DRAFT_504170 [Xylariales sp. PMI_506]